METYLFLDTPTKKQLINLARVNQLSLSTASAIIIKWYYLPINALYKNYIKKGDNQIHIKIRNELQRPITAINATNCVYSYFNRPKQDLKINWRALNNSIRKDLQNTYDKNANKNIEIRIAYRIKKGNI